MGKKRYPSEPEYIYLPTHLQGVEPLLSLPPLPPLWTFLVASLTLEHLLVRSHILFKYNIKPAKCHILMWGFSLKFPVTYSKFPGDVFGN